jgi:hypothetical protein
VAGFELREFHTHLAGGANRFRAGQQVLVIEGHYLDVIGNGQLACSPVVQKPPAVFAHQFVDVPVDAEDLGLHLGALSLPAGPALVGVAPPPANWRPRSPPL